MEHRTSFALDEATIDRLKKLAALWRVSQAEVVRRAIEHADTQASMAVSDRLDRLSEYHAQGGLDPASADAYVAELAAMRDDWARDS